MKVVWREEFVAFARFVKLPVVLALGRCGDFADWLRDAREFHRRGLLEGWHAERDFLVWLRSKDFEKVSR